MQIPRDLFGQIFRPDQQELAKLQVRPKHHQSEQKVAEIVPTVRRYHLGERLLTFQKSRCQDRQGQGRQSEAHHKDHSKDGRIPLGLEGHHPIDGGERNSQPIKHETGSAEPLQSQGQCAVSRAVLLK